MPETYHFHKDSAMTAIGNAIRTKNGLQTLYTEDDMAAAILAIPSGGSDEEIEKLLAGTTGTFDFRDIEVTSLRSYCFERMRMTGIVLPTTLVTVGERAFNYCTSLRDITWPTALITINANAFYSCTKLAFSELPDSIQTINASAFNNCTSLKNLALPNSLKTLQSTVFQSCTALENVWIPGTATNVFGSSTSNTPFLGCTAMTDIYTSATSKPSGWGQYFNYTSNGTQATVHWGVSKAEYEEIINS